MNVNWLVSALNVRADERLGHVDERAAEVVLPNRIRAVMNVRQERILEPGLVGIEFAFLGGPGLRALLTHAVQAGIGQDSSVQEIPFFAIELQILGSECPMMKQVWLRHDQNLRRGRYALGAGLPSAFSLCVRQHFWIPLTAQPTLRCAARESSEIH